MKKIKPYIYFFSFVFIIIFSFYVVFDEKGYKDYAKLLRDRDKLLEVNKALKEKNTKLEKRIKEFDDEKYIETIARKERGMIRKDEKIYKLIKKKKEKNGQTIKTD